MKRNKQKERKKERKEVKRKERKKRHSMMPFENKIVANSIGNSNFATYNNAVQPFIEAFTSAPADNND
jgi:hypothetical protein